MPPWHIHIIPKELRNEIQNPFCFIQFLLGTGPGDPCMQHGQRNPTDTSPATEAVTEKPTEKAHRGCHR